MYDIEDILNYWPVFVSVIVVLMAGSAAVAVFTLGGESKENPEESIWRLIKKIWVTNVNGKVTILTVIAGLAFWFTNFTGWVNLSTDPGRAILPTAHTNTSTFVTPPTLQINGPNLPIATLTPTSTLMPTPVYTPLPKATLTPAPTEEPIAKPTIPISPEVLSFEIAFPNEPEVVNIDSGNPHRYKVLQNTEVLFEWITNEMAVSVTLIEPDRVSELDPNGRIPRTITDDGNYTLIAKTIGGQYSPPQVIQIEMIVPPSPQQPPLPPTPSPTPRCLSDSASPFYLELPKHNSVFNRSQNIPIKLKLRSWAHQQYEEFLIFYYNQLEPSPIINNWKSLHESRRIIQCSDPDNCIIEDTWAIPPSGVYWLSSQLFRSSGGNYTEPEYTAACAVQITILD